MPVIKKTEPLPTAARLKTEREKDYESIRKSYWNEFQPVGGLEKHFVEDMVVCETRWRFYNRVRSFLMNLQNGPAPEHLDDLAHNSGSLIPKLERRMREMKRFKNQALRHLGDIRKDKQAA